MEDERSKQIQAFADNKTEQIIKTSAFNGAVDLVSAGFKPSQETLEEVKKMADVLEKELRNRLTTTSVKGFTPMVVEPRKSQVKPVQEDFDRELYKKSINQKSNEDDESYRKRLKELADYWQDKDNGKWKYIVIGELLGEVGKDGDELPF